MTLLVFFLLFSSTGYAGLAWALSILSPKDAGVLSSFPITIRLGKVAELHPEDRACVVLDGVELCPPELLKTANSLVVPTLGSGAHSLRALLYDSQGMTHLGPLFYPLPRGSLGNVTAATMLRTFSIHRGHPLGELLKRVHREPLSQLPTLLKPAADVFAHFIAAQGHPALLLGLPVAGEHLSDLDEWVSCCGHWKVHARTTSIDSENPVEAAGEERDPGKDIQSGETTMKDFVEDFLMFPEEGTLGHVGNLSIAVSALSAIGMHSPELGEVLGPSELLTATLWSGSKGHVMPAHYDQSDRLILMAAGRKLVKLWPPAVSVAQCTSQRHPVWWCGVARAEGGPEDPLTELPGQSVEVELRHGNVLYLPAGWAHSVEVTEAAISVTLEPHPGTRAALATPANLPPARALFEDAACGFLLHAHESSGDVAAAYCTQRCGADACEALRQEAASAASWHARRTQVEEALWGLKPQRVFALEVEVHGRDAVFELHDNELPAGAVRRFLNLHGLGLASEEGELLHAEAHAAYKELAIQGKAKATPHVFSAADIVRPGDAVTSPRALVGMGGSLVMAKALLGLVTLLKLLAPVFVLAVVPGVHRPFNAEGLLARAVDRAGRPPIERRSAPCNGVASTLKARGTSTWPGLRRVPAHCLRHLAQAGLGQERRWKRAVPAERHLKVLHQRGRARWSYPEFIGQFYA
ncbi:hypothetical protein CYMTET_19001 [Cymbomonas tetramitiformis]|uniref:Cupin-like domain-containing protein n=1 Tax=Cymbomonas tetramitiformis TaxID=36881 RepID=A0AAE0L5S2_9CHLO|nr:hypothetical protein CYMTET_19001 [Cymbomonas tetramitiformis]